MNDATSSSHDEISEGYGGFTSDESVEKDEAELELEKLVFGDEAGFLADLSAHQFDFSKQWREGGAEGQELDALPGAQHGLEAVDDADVRSHVLILQAR